MTPAARFPVPGARTRVTDEVKGSRFIATATRAATADEARAFIAAVREEFADATHNCWAYVAGPPGTVAAGGASDDGEPGGTAGRPMLNVLLHSGVGEIVVVVTRYFGGVKLGRGGLVRAYGNSVRHVLRELPLAEWAVTRRIRVTVPYALGDVARRIVTQCGGAVASESFAEATNFDIDVAVDAEERLVSELMNATSGAARIDVDPIE